MPENITKKKTKQMLQILTLMTLIFFLYLWLFRSALAVSVPDSAVANALENAREHNLSISWW